MRLSPAYQHMCWAKVKPNTHETTLSNFAEFCGVLGVSKKLPRLKPLYNARVISNEDSASHHAKEVPCQFLVLAAKVFCPPDALDPN